MPSISPMTAIPSSHPTITGSIASVSISGSITEEVSKADVDSLTSELASIYGVPTSEVEIDVDFVTSGTLDVTIPSGVSDEEVVRGLEESISDVLGVHTSDVVVTIGEGGTVVYSVTGASYDDISVIQNKTADELFASQVDEDLKDNASPIAVDSAKADPDIEVVISATIDTSEADITVNVIEALTNLTESYGFTNVTSEGIFINLHCKYD